MAKFDQLCRMAAEFSDVADFLVVYIEEAHPTDGWAFENNYSIQSHRTIEDRVEAARLLVVDNLTVVADNMEAEANHAYGGLFERLYVVHNGVVAYQGARGPSGFKPDEVENWLTGYKALIGEGTVDMVGPAGDLSACCALSLLAS
jgi:type I thyroxine 5'-deiodinase